MNRFEKTHFPTTKIFTRVIPIAFIIFLLVLFINGINSVSATTESKQMESLKTAMERSIAQCYAVEGSYPADVAYLTNHYGLTYDNNKFIVQYTYIGSNIYPEYVVLYRTGTVLLN